MKKLLSLLLTAVMLCSVLAVFTVPASALSNKFVTGNVEITGNESYNMIFLQGGTLTVKSGASLTATDVTSFSNLIIESGATLTVTRTITTGPTSSIKVDGMLTSGKDLLSAFDIKGSVTIGENGIIKVKTTSGTPACLKPYCTTMQKGFTVIQKSHSMVDGKCSRCGRYACDIKSESHEYQNGKCTKCGFVCQNDFHKDYNECPECGMRVSFSVGSVFAKGSTTIIVGVAAAVIFGGGGFLLGRKKKKPIAANGAAEEKPDEDDE